MTAAFAHHVLRGLLLQVRQEVAHIARFGAADLECTSFTVSGPFPRYRSTPAKPADWGQVLHSYISAGRRDGSSMKMS